MRRRRRVRYKGLVVDEDLAMLTGVMLALILAAAVVGFVLDLLRGQ